MKVVAIRRYLGWLPLALLLLLCAAVWAVFFSGGMASVQAWLILMTLLPLVAVIVLLATLWRTLHTRSKIGRLVLTLAVGVFCFWPAAWQLGPVGHGAFAFPFALASTAPHVTVRLPTNAQMRVIWGGDDLTHNQHAATPDQRWAYDLAVDPVLVRTKKLGDYGCWGVPVVAPSSGRVHASADGVVDQEPGAVSTDYAHAFGNHVIIALDGGGYLVLAHLQRGSVIVHEGDTVTEGTRIGACGNSGHSSEPHVHIHAQRQDPRTNPINYAEGLPLFFRGHDGAPMPLGGVMRPSTATGAVVRHVVAGDLHTAR
ncbi:MAG: hypothetical protein RL701_2826 [Pseudomonadota bacterium]|jgi:hypothetical protein